MWLWMSLLSAILLGSYDVAKKQALRKNGVMWVLFSTTLLSTLFLVPFLSAGSLRDHITLIIKAVLVSSSWISGMIGLEKLPITTVSTIKASRPAIVVAFSIILFRERLNVLQWCGVALVLVSLWMLRGSTRKEGISFRNNSGLFWMIVSVITGAASALYDKHILSGSLQPLFVQSWTNVYISIILGIILLIMKIREKEGFARFKPDWTVVLIAVFITAADALYFLALKQEGAMLSVISLIRRSSVLITFLAGGLLFKEKGLRSKAVELALMLGGIILLMLGS